MLVDYMTKLVVYNRTHLINGMLGDQCVENNDFAETPETWDVGIWVAGSFWAINDFDFWDINVSFFSLGKDSSSKLTLLQVGISEE